MTKSSLRQVLSSIMNGKVPVNIALKPTGNIGGIITKINSESGMIVELNGQAIDLTRCKEIQIPLP